MKNLKQTKTIFYNNAVVIQANIIIRQLFGIKSCPEYNLHYILNVIVSLYGKRTEIERNMFSYKCFLFLVKVLEENKLFNFSKDYSCFIGDGNVSYLLLCILTFIEDNIDKIKKSYKIKKFFDSETILLLDQLI